MAVRLESMIGDKRVPLWFQIQHGTILVWSLCMRVSTAAPLWVIQDASGEKEDLLEIRRLLRKAGYTKITILDRQ